MSLAKVQRTYESLIMSGIARVLWSHAYGTWADEDIANRDPDVMGDLELGATTDGRRWVELAPATPGAANSAAKDLAKLIAVTEGMPNGYDDLPLTTLFAMVMEIDTGQAFEFVEPTIPEPPKRPEIILFLDSSRGQYIPQNFVEQVLPEALVGARADDIATLRLGPTQENEPYWDAWFDFSQMVRVRDKAGVLYFIDQTENGDVLLVPEGMSNGEDGDEEWHWPTYLEPPPSLPEQFGRALAHMALRDGASWFDEHKQSNGHIEWKPAIPSMGTSYDGIDLEWASSGDLPKSESTDRRIRISYSLVTPGPEDGDEADVENGWDDEDGVVIEEEEDETLAETTAKFLQREGGTSASSSMFHPGVWYSQPDGNIDQRTGAVRIQDFHLYGYTLEEEEAVYKEMHTGNARRTARR